MKSKFAKVALASTVAMSVSSVASAAGLNDINVPWAKVSIDKLVASGAITGYPDNTFKPGKQITRAEFTTIINKSFGKYDQNAAASFSDVHTYQWFYKQVASAKEAGYVNGYPNNTFAPNNSITRAEAAMMVANLLKLDTASVAGTTFKDSLPQWAKGSITALAAKHIVSGYTDGSFKPASLITRAEAAVMLDKALDAQSNPTPVQQSQGIQGTVTLDGAVAAGATVQAYAANGYTAAKSATTDANGKFTLDVPAGSYYLVATKDKNIGYVSGVTASAAASVTADIKLAKGVTVSGKLLDTNGNALKNAKFAFAVDGVSFTGTTDSAGAYSLLVPGDKTYTVSVENPSQTADGLQIVSKSVSIGNGDQTVSDLKAPFTIYSGGGGGGGSTGGQTNNNTAIVSSISKSTDFYGDTVIDVVTNGSSADVKINGVAAQRVGISNEYRYTFDKGTPQTDIQSVQVGTKSVTLSKTTDFYGDTIVSVYVSGTSKAVTLNGTTSLTPVTGNAGEYRTTFDSASVPAITSITIS